MSEGLYGHLHTVGLVQGLVLAGVLSFATIPNGSHKWWFELIAGTLIDMYGCVEADPCRYFPN